MYEVDTHELERILVEDGWDVATQDNTRSKRRGGSFRLVLTAPTGVRFDCIGGSRAEALRAAAAAAGLLEPKDVQPARTQAAPKPVPR